ncbi:hypothetical protein SCHPADRAFT_947222, partial [Schizopora paradoxa]
MATKVRHTAPPNLPNQSTPIKPTGRGIGIDLSDINNMTHNKIDVSEKKSMNSFLVENVVSLAEVLLPDAALGFNATKLLKKMKENGVYASQRWNGWPETLKPGQEEDINKFLEETRTAMDTSLRNLEEEEHALSLAVEEVDPLPRPANELIPLSSLPASSHAATSQPEPVSTGNP